MLRGDIWLVEQLGGSTDPFFQEKRHKQGTRPNRNDLENEYSRPAVDVLRDLIAKFRSLEWLPGGLYSTGWREYKPMKEIYQTAGWPDNFDTSLFDRLRLEYEEAEMLFRRQVTPLEELDTLLRNEKDHEQYLAEIIQLEKEIPELDLRIKNEPFSEKDRADMTVDYWNKMQRLKNCRKWTIPLSKEEWAQRQAEERKELEKVQADRQSLLNRQGRFDYMSDEQHNKAIEEDWFGPDIERLKISIADKSESARRRREERETRAEAAALDPAIIEKWLEYKVAWEGKDGEWATEWMFWFEAGQRED